MRTLRKGKLKPYMHALKEAELIKFWIENFSDIHSFNLSI